MSKLYDQLKRAAQTRAGAARPEPASQGSLLQTALKRAESERERARAKDEAPAQEAVERDPIAAEAARRRAQADDDAALAAGREASSHGAIAPMSSALARGAAAVAAAIAIVAAWQAWGPVQREVAKDAAAPARAGAPFMKLDYALDLSRTGGGARSSPPGPGPSR